MEDFLAHVQGKFGFSIKSGSALLSTVDALKAGSADGKLTQDEITDLGQKLLSGALAKMSDSGIEVLKAANVDINAIVTGAGEALIAQMKEE